MQFLLSLQAENMKQVLNYFRLIINDLLLLHTALEHITSPQPQGSDPYYTSPVKLKEGMEGELQPGSNGLVTVARRTSAKLIVMSLRSTVIPRHLTKKHLFMLYFKLTLYCLLKYLCRCFPSFLDKELSLSTIT